MLSLALLIHIQRQTGNFTIPGLVLGAMSLGQAMASPINSRAMGIFGIRKVIGTLLILSNIFITIVALVPLEWHAFIIAGFIIGCTLTPIQPAARAVYPTLVPRTQIQSLVSLDASIQEIIWIAGPVITVMLATQINSTAAVLSSVIFGGFGGLWFLSRPEVGSVKLEPATGKMGAVLRKPPVLIGVASGLLVVGSFGAIEASTVAVFGSEPDSPAGIILGLWALTSLIGGLAMGHTPMGPWSLSRRLSIVAAGTALAMFTTDPVLLTFALLVSGIGVAPSMTVQYSIATESVNRGDIPESLGWLATGWIIGAAIASAIAGFTIDQLGPSGGFIIATAFAVAAALVPAIFVRKLPDLRQLSH
jgi:MFS family permease